MPYTQPSGNVLDFNIGGAYTPPIGSYIEFNFAADSDSLNIIAGGYASFYGAGAVDIGVAVDGGGAVAFYGEISTLDTNVIYSDGGLSLSGSVVVEYYVPVFTARGFGKAAFSGGIVVSVPQQISIAGGGGAVAFSGSSVANVIHEVRAESSGKVVISGQALLSTGLSVSGNGALYITGEAQSPQNIFGYGALSIYGEAISKRAVSVQPYGVLVLYGFSLVETRQPYEAQGSGELYFHGGSSIVSVSPQITHPESGLFVVVRHRPHAVKLSKQVVYVLH